jgi:PhnB protein
MSSRPSQFPWMSPYLTVKIVDDAIDFYAKAFGFTLKERSKGEDGVTIHAELFYKDQLLMLGPEGNWGNFETKTPKTSGVNSPINLYLYCEEVDKFYQHAISAGAEGFSPPEDMFWGDRMCRLTCPEGYVWAFATYLGVPCLGGVAT